MIEDAANLLNVAEATIWQFFAVFLRVGAIVSLMPGVGENMVPTRVKLAIGLAFTVIVATALDPIFQPLNLRQMTIFFLAEAGIGLAMGFGLRMFVLALQTAGSIAANATSLAQILGGAAAEPLPAISFVLVLSGLALAMILDLHIYAVLFMLSTYDLFPAGQFPNPSVISSWGVAQVARSFALAFAISAPFVIASLLYNLALGAINRAMPQLMVAFVGAPVITFGGLAILFLAAPTMIALWSAQLIEFMTNPMAAPQ